MRKKPTGILDPGSRGQKGTGAWIRIRNTGSQLRFKYMDMSAKVDLHVRMFMLGVRIWRCMSLSGHIAYIYPTCSYEKGGGEEAVL
jgi:hypothetical protein